MFRPLSFSAATVLMAVALLVLPASDTAHADRAIPAPEVLAPGVERPSQGAELFDLPDWERWLFLNRLRHVPLRSTWYERGVIDGRETDPTPHRLDPGQRSELIARLLEIAKTKRDLAASALYAAAMSSTVDDARAVTLDVQAYLASPDVEGRELAILALGLAGDAEGIATLSAILLDSEAGRAALGTDDDLPEQTRALAAIALGASHDSRAIVPLTRALEQNVGTARDLETSAVAALGALAGHLEGAPSAEVERTLIGIMRDEDRDDATRAAVPPALAHSTAASAEALLFSAIGDEEQPLVVRQSAARALGALSTKVSADTLTKALAALEQAENPSVVEHLTLSIGRLAAKAELRAPPAEDDDDLPHDSIEHRLAIFYEAAFEDDALRNTARPWLALSAGHFGGAHEAWRPWLAGLLEAWVEDAARKSDRIAAIVGLGQIGAAESREVLKKALAEESDPRTRGYAAEAYALTLDPAAAEPLRKLLSDPDTPAESFGAALGLMRLGDRTVIDRLFTSWKQSGNEAVAIGLARLAGETGDRALLAPLWKMYEAAGQDDRAARRALLALGRLGDPRMESFTNEFIADAYLERSTGTLRRVTTLH